MTNGSQPPGGFEPPRHPGKTNDLDPRLVEKLQKMKYELEACRSLKEEIRGQQQTARRQAPAGCQPDTTLQRQLEEANQRIANICEQVLRYYDREFGENRHPTWRPNTTLSKQLYHRYCKQNPCYPSRC